MEYGPAPNVLGLLIARDRLLLKIEGWSDALPTACPATLLGLFTEILMFNSKQIAVPSSSEVAKGAIVSGAINAVINGAIQWYLLSGHGPLPLTVDSISTDEHTVFGAAVPLAVSLAMILTAVAYTTVKRPKPRFYPTFLWMTIKHGFFALGVIVTFAVLWQRVLGSILVPLAAAVIILGLVAGVVAAVVNYMTIMESHLRSQSGSPDAG
jgi:hypothetical protein